MFVGGPPCPTKGHRSSWPSHCPLHSDSPTHSSLSAVRGCGEPAPTQSGAKYSENLQGHKGEFSLAASQVGAGVLLVLASSFPGLALMPDDSAFLEGRDCLKSMAKNSISPMYNQRECQVLTC